jgi:density-regulated protein DRP1
LYSEYNSNTQKTKCKAWLKENQVELFNRLFPEEAVTEALENTTLEEIKEAKEEVSQPQQPQKKKLQKEKKVTIKMTSRNKKKSITTIQGLEHFDVDLKKAAKLFANKYACGSSVSRNAQGTEEITIQGDVQDQVKELIVTSFSISAALIEIAPPKK